MEIGKVIRTYRKKKHMTQEEMADRLGVTAPAVNKWEKGNAMPDILLLAPIARLLGITTDELLSFREEMTAEEINRFIYELDARFNEEPFDQVFGWAKKRLEEYPGCYQLIWQTAMVLYARICTHQAEDAWKYEDDISGWYGRALESRDEAVRVNAAGALFSFWMKKEEYGKAQSCLAYMSDQNPEKKRKQGMIYEKTGQVEEAYRVYEEILFSFYGNLMLVLDSICALDMEQQDWERVEMLAKKQSEAAKLFDMGQYNGAEALSLAAARKDVDATVKVVEEIMEHVDNLQGYCDSPLYKHLKFRSLRREFSEGVKKTLMEKLREGEDFGYMKGDRRWQELVGEAADSCRDSENRGSNP